MAHLAIACVMFLSMASLSFGAEAARRIMPGQVPAVSEFKVTGKVPLTNRVSLAIGLPLRNQSELDEFLRQLYDPRSPKFHKYLTPSEFTARFAPTEADYQAVIGFARENGLKVTGTHANRVVLEVEGSVSNVDQAFQIGLGIYHDSIRHRDFFAPDTEPSVPADLPVAEVWGLSDYSKPTPLAHQMDPARVTALNYNGSGPSGAYQGRDFRNAYVPETSLTGSGQIAGVVEFDGYYSSDIATYEANCGYNAVPLTNVLLGVSGTPGYSGMSNAVVEVSLDIELLIAMAPGLSKLMVYEGDNPYTVLNQIANDNVAKQISCSWSWPYGPTRKWGVGHGSSTLDSILSQMAAQGQSFFQASGDSDAYTGSQAVNSSTGPIPVDSIYVTSVGGTTLTMNGTGSSWGSETVWNWGNNFGSGGGVSSNYPIPSWQTNVSMANNSGSTAYRNFPDVALTADAIEVVYDNGSSGIFGGTSCAAPLWAGFTALVNEQAAATGNAPVGFLNPALYGIAAGPNYAACFHDTTTGNNIGTNTPGLYDATFNYDLATGLGTPNGTNLINALAPPASPYLITQPLSQTVTNGADVTFTASAGGQSPLSYQWRFNDTDLAEGGNVSGATGNTLTLTAVTPVNAGSYRVVVTNSYGSATSSVATLAVVLPPSFTTQPTNQSVLASNSAFFSATATGATPIAYQWRQNGTNLVNGGNISGATSNALNIASAADVNAGNYSLVAMNIYGRATSAVATLTVLLPPSITVPLLAQSVECGGKTTFSIGASGTPPLRYQWFVDGVATSGATNTSFSLTNVSLPNHTVAVVVTNLYGTASSSAALTVQDTLPPVITLNGANPFYLELGSTYTEPGATALDVCAGIVPVTVSGSVDANVISTNTVNYHAADGNGNTSTLTRNVIVRDTTPPVISWSFTNLVLAADAGCGSAMPNVTGTNFILASDVSGVLAISQNPAKGAILPLGTNTVVLAVADASGNKSYSTNHVTVRDQTPPLLTVNGANPMTTELGTVFTDPGVIASDNCPGPPLVTTNGLVNVNVVGTNTVTYDAIDSSGNSNSVSRTVLVRDTTPPSILWSFTNQVLAADASCTATMPDVSGTNFILAADSSGAVTISQSPASGTALALGTNVVVATVTDASGNKSYSTNQMAVRDLTPPVITVLGADPFYVELGSGYADPGATAGNDCSGVLLTTNVAVRVDLAGTNMVTYRATDGSGNTSTATRVVIVRDTTSPTILWSFGDFVQAADATCSALMPDVTGTNFILAADSSGTVTISQNPASGTLLPLGTNNVVIAVTDASGNVSYSTNRIAVRDQTPPRIVTPPQDQTSVVGGTASFSVAASACSPLSFQWFFDNGALGAETNTTLRFFNVTSTMAGQYFVVATAAGGSTTSAVVTLTVTLVNSSVTLVSRENPAGFNDSLNWFATVSPNDATGTILFLTNGTAFNLAPVIAGAATSTSLSTLPRGTNQVAAIYSGDSNYQAATNWLEQIVTNNPPLVLPVSYTLLAGSSLQIAVSDLATNWSDADGDSLFVDSISTSTNGVVITNALPALFYSNPNNVDDQFVCAISDGYGGTSFQTVSITVLPQSNSNPLISGVALQPDGRLVLSLNGRSASTYILESSVELPSAAWEPLTTNTVSVTGVWQFTDFGTTNTPGRFYRLKLVQ